MLYQKNLPIWERGLRVVVGLALVGYALVGAPSTWMFQVVKHECYRLLRRFRRETALDQAAVEQHTGDALADQAALSHDVAGAIAALEPHYRQVLIMRDVQQMTAPEVAATLGLTVAAVKSRLHRARMLVRATLQGPRGASQSAI